MNYYYYPLCTKDFTFENIFASESISPFIFYSRRGFGIDYFYKIPQVHHEKAIVLFEEPPMYETGVENSNVAKFILAVGSDSLTEAGKIKIDNGIIGYKETIYLNKTNFNILFFSEIEKKVTCLRSETSLPTKRLEKYNDNFKLITESECKNYDLSSIGQLKIDEEGIEATLKFDRDYNAFKGFVYGVVAGIIGEKPREMIAIKRSLQEITNSFAEIRNRKDIEVKGLGTRYAKTFGVEQEPIKKFYEKLVFAIATSEKLFYEIFPPQVVTEEDIAAYLLSIKGERLRSLEEAMQYISYRVLDDELFGFNGFHQLKTRYIAESGKKDPSIYYDRLKVLAEQFLRGTRNSNLTSDKKRSSDDTTDFKEIIYELSKFLDEKVVSPKQPDRVDLGVISFDHRKEAITIDPGFEDLRIDELEEYQMIINIILRNPKFGKGETKKEQVLSIVEETGGRKNKVAEGKRTKLYRYLNNEINDYSIEMASSVVMKNFVAFIFNVDSIESLEDYIEVNEIEKKWISTSFWCLFNGFANTSGHFVRHVFASGNERIQTYVDDYLRTKFSRGLVENKSVEELKVAEPQESYEKKHEKDSDVTHKVEEFYSRFVKGKFDIGLEKFMQIFRKGNPEQILNELKSKHKVLKKDGKILIALFKDQVSAGTLF